MGNLGAPGKLPVNIPTAYIDIIIYNRTPRALLYFIDSIADNATSNF